MSGKNGELSFHAFVCRILGVATGKDACLEITLDAGVKVRQKLAQTLRSKGWNWRQREVLNCLYQIGGGYAFTTKEVAKIFKTTAEDIVKVESRAVSNLNKDESLRQDIYKILGCQ